MDLEALERLARLKESGALTEEEFNLQKQRILESGFPGIPPRDRRSQIAFWGGGALIAATLAFFALGGFGERDDLGTDPTAPVESPSTSDPLADASTPAVTAETPASKVSASPNPIETTLASSAIPKRVGDCASTSIKSVGTRLRNEDGTLVPESGSDVKLRNGVYGVSYGTVPEIVRSKRGDRVSTCLVELPEDCPPGDERGRVYTTTNLRTGESWTLADASHMCGGA